VNKKSIQNQRQSGAVSLFVVIFAALLMTVVTVSFIQLMVNDQKQATANDLSQSAYDSAQAGVEDAKRLLLLDQACKNGTAPGGIDCAAVADALVPVAGSSETDCDALARARVVGEVGKETIVQQEVGDAAAALDQAYTCVKITPNTENYRGQLAMNESTMIPLIGDGEFNQIELSWFNKDDVATGTDAATMPVDTGKLPPVGSRWGETTPALMRAQLIQASPNFKLADLNDSQGGKSNASTLFLYPRDGVGIDLEFINDARRSGTNDLQNVKCSLSFSELYLCSTKIKLPDPRDGSASNRMAYLRLSTLYNASHFMIKLYNTDTGSSLVRFKGVQPQVDSTGRANDMFRRVQALVELKGVVTYPEAAVDIAGNLCKNFLITDTESHYVNKCTP
jgi:Tfp pilus assembly protein PilX